MKLLLTIIIFISCTAPSFSVHAQEGNILSRKTTWRSSRSVIMTSNAELKKSCTVITDVNQNKIVLDQGGSLSEFKIVKHTGTWDNIAENGSITFSITYDEQPGSITIEKNDEGEFITLDMSQNSSGVKRKIIVNQIITE